MPETKPAQNGLAQEGKIYRFKSSEGEEYEYDVRNKLVDASYLTGVVPSMRPVPFPVAEGMKVVPVNAIADLKQHANCKDFIILGAGKTGMDACNHLLRNGVDCKNIRWIVPNDSFIIDRDYAFGTASPVIAGGIYPLDRKVEPKNWKCATLSREEYHALKTVNIVRKGRVTEVTKYSLIMKGGRETVNENTLFVDCTSNGLTSRPAVTVFSHDKLVL